jgi:hypothetical protein
MKSSLLRSEWLLAFTAATVLFSLVILAKFQSFRTKLVTPPPVNLVELHISGHVRKPGLYSVELGTPMLEVIVKAQPKAYADLSVFFNEVAADEARECVVAPLAELHVHVSGACAEVDLHLPVGSRVSDLKAKLSLAPEADLSFFKKTRLLKNEENIKIPLKEWTKKNL